MQQTTCHIKFIINPHIERNITLRFMPDKNAVLLKIMVTNTTEIHGMLQRVCHMLNLQGHGTNPKWHLEYNWKNCPTSVQNDSTIKSLLEEYFGYHLMSESVTASNVTTSKDTINVDINQTAYDIMFLVSKVRTHIKVQGQAPDMVNLDTLKKQAKAYNYICNVLGMPHLSLDRALEIAKLI